MAKANKIFHWKHGWIAIDGSAGPGNTPAIPQDKIAKRIQALQPFTYDPGKGKLDHSFGLEGKATAPALKKGTTVDIAAPDDASIKAAVARVAASSGGKPIGGHFWVPTNSYRVGVVDPTGQRPSEDDTIPLSATQEISTTVGWGARDPRMGTALNSRKR